MNESIANDLAEQISALLKASSAMPGDELRSTIEKLSQRLDRLESQFLQGSSGSAVETPKSIHPSLHRFQDLGEIADVILDRINNSKECPYEPAGKPCDNCSMCSSRGF